MVKTWCYLLYIVVLFIIAYDVPATSEIIIQEGKNGYTGCEDAVIYNNESKNQLESTSKEVMDINCDRLVIDKYRCWQSAADKFTRLVIQFNLSNVAINTTIQKATFSIYRTGNIAEGPYLKNPTADFIKDFDYDCTFLIHKLTKAWKENSAKWDDLNNAHDPKELDKYDFKRGYKGWIEFDVTSTVKEFVKNPNKNFGFVLLSTLVQADNNSGNCSEFWSSEAKEITMRPKLTLFVDNTALFKKNTEIKDFHGVGVSIFQTHKEIRVTLPQMSETFLRIFSLTGKDITHQVNKQINQKMYILSLDALHSKIALLYICNMYGTKTIKLCPFK